MTSFTAALLLFVAGLTGGAVNAVAGGGSFFVFPTMLLAGVPPVGANATTAVALWPAGLASSVAYRRDLPPDRKALVVLSIVSAIGGGLGAKLLLGTSDATFVRLLPLLMGAASAVFTFGPRIAKHERRLPLAVGATVQLVIAIYGGYFGGGMGILMLATMTLMGMREIHAMNALKIVFGLLINGVALVAFVAAGSVAYRVALPAAVGAITGGFCGAALAKRVAPAKIRTLVLVFAWSLTAWFTVRAALG